MELKDGADFAKKIWGDSEKLARLEAIMPNRQVFDDFVERLKTESMLTRGAKSYPGAARHGATSIISDAVAATRAAKGDVLGGGLDALRARLGMPEREAKSIVEFGFGRPRAQEFAGIERYLLDPPVPGPARTIMGGVSPLGLLGQRDPEIDDQLRADRDAMP